MKTSIFLQCTNLKVCLHIRPESFEGTLMGFVLGYISKQDIPSCHAVNRLDRYTSGIVLFAKNAYAKSIFSSTMQKASKEYLAVVYGDVESKKVPSIYQ